MTHTRSWRLTGASALLVACACTAAHAQQLARRVAAAPDGSVQFLFAARPDVCGNGRSWLSAGDGIWQGTFSGNLSDASRSADCQHGPVRVVLDRADREIVGINVYAGPPSTTPDVIDLGTVPAREASEYLLSLAATLEGKPGREAILPAVLADSAAPTNALLAIARDARRPRDTRRSAMTWLGREAQRQPAEASRAVKELTAIARDQDDQQTVRSHALATLARFGRGEGIPVLVELSNAAADPWLARSALQSLARSGDPRARQALRAAIQRKDLGDEARSAAIRGLAQEYATSKDAEFLRAQFPTLGERSRDAVISALAEMGGSENARWLMSVARDEQQPVSTRRRALTSAQRAGTPVADIVALYDALHEQELKEATMSVLAQSGTKSATDKLLTIARSDPNYQLRRRAVSQLSRSDDPRVREALKDIVVK
jgi:hypothetical protein